MCIMLYCVWSIVQVQESQLQRADATTTSAPMSTHDQFDTFVREPDPTLVRVFLEVEHV